MMLQHFTNSQKVLWADFDPREQYIITVDETCIKLWDLEQNISKVYTHPDITNPY